MVIHLMFLCLYLHKMDNSHTTVFGNEFVHGSMISNSILLLNQSDQSTSWIFALNVMCNQNYTFRII